MEKTHSKNGSGHCSDCVFGRWFRCGLPGSALAFLCAVFLQGEACAQQNLQDYALIYVDQYFEPPAELSLTEGGKNKAAALAHFTVGRIQENAGQLDQAVVSYLKVLELQPNQLSLSRKCALILARSGKQKQARELLESALSRNSTIAFPYIMLSEFLSTYHSNIQENKERSLGLAREAVEKFPDDPVPYEHLAKVFMIGNRKDEAKELLTGALDRENSDPNFWLRLGKVASRVWQYRLGGKGQEEQIAMLNQFYGKAAEFAGNNDLVKERSADYYSATRQFDLAEKMFKELIAKNTDRLDLRKKLAKVYRAQKDDQAYLDTLLGIVEVNPSDVSTHYEISKAYAKLNDMTNSIKHRLIALKVGKGSAEDYLKVGTEMYEAEMNAEAVEFLEEAAYLFPDNHEFPWLITYPLGALERYKEAVKYFEAYEKLVKKNKPENLNEKFYFRYGASVERAGDIKRAEKLFQKTIEILGKKDPQQENKEFTATVYNYLGYMWLENDMNIDRAGELIKTAVDLDPSSGAIADSLGWYYFKKGRFEEALKELLRSESLIKEMDAVILDHIGQAYYKLGDHEKAVDYMKRAVDLEPGKKEFSDRLKHFQTNSNDVPPKPTEAQSAPQPENPDSPSPPRPAAPSPSGANPDA